MKSKIGIVALAFAALLGLASPSQSATPIGPGYYSEAGKWLVTVTFDEPASGSLTAWYDIVGHYYSDAAFTQYAGGWAIPSHFLGEQALFTKATSAKVRFEIPPEYKGLEYADQQWGPWEWIIYGRDIELVATNDAGHAVTGIWSITAVPEPGTWAIMIVGFGLAGSALRSRRLPSQRLLPAAR